jgi:hypothetical protein
MLSETSGDFVDVEHPTRHPEGVIGLWRSLVGKKRFPVQCLTDAGETLQEFVAAGNER